VKEVELVLHKKCPRCGNEIELDDSALPEEGWAREVGEKLPVLCESCSAEQDRLERAEALRREREAHEARVRASGLPRELRAVTFDRLDRDKVNEASIASGEEWASSKVRGLVLSGDVGVGKTWIAAAATNRKLEYAAVNWCPVARLIAAMRADLGSKVREEANRLLLESGTALVLDDLDKAKPTDFVLDILYEAIDGRMANGTPLLVTTNLGYRDLVKKIGEPIASRLRGYCKGHRIEGSDRRVPV
jgi:DNA replication protein DnaC